MRKIHVGLTLGTLLACLVQSAGRPSDAGARATYSGTGGLSPKAITRGPDGNLWFIDGRGGLARCTPAGVITSFPLLRATSSPESIAAGPDGSLWFTEHLGTRIGRLTVQGALTEYVLPHAIASPFGSTSRDYTSSIIAAPDGNLWFTEPGRRVIGRITLRGAIAEFALPHFKGEITLIPPEPGDITAGLDGNIWFTLPSAGRIGRITPAGVVRIFVVAKPPDTFESMRSIASGPDGALWFTEANAIGHSTVDGAITALPTENIEPAQLAAGPDGSLWLTARGSPGNHLYRVSIHGRVNEIHQFSDDWDSTPTSITAGPDGNLWFTEELKDALGRITPEGAITEFPLTPRSRSLQDLTPGPDGNLWFTEANDARIGSITPNGVVREFRLPSTSRPSHIAAVPDGNLWFTDASGMIGRMSVRGRFTRFALTSAKSSPEGIAAGADGNIWFTEPDANKIGRITSSGAISEYLIPTPKSGVEDITPGPDGNLWFTEPGTYPDNDTAKIGRIAPDGTIREFRIMDRAVGSGELNGITAGPDGNLWFTLSIADRIGRITPSGIVTLFQLGRPQDAGNIFLQGITAGPDGDLWFAEGINDRIGHISPRGKSVDMPMPAGRSEPTTIVAGPDGNLWCIGYADNVVWRVSPGGTFTRFIIR